MPIIRLAGSAGGGIAAAGEASAAFQQASRPGIQGFQRALEVEKEMELRKAGIELRRQEQDAIAQDREQRAATNRAISDRQNAVRYSGAETQAGKRVGMVPAPFDGFGAFSMFDELAQTDPEVAKQLFASLSQEFGDLGQELTPELLEQDPRFPAVYSQISEAVIQSRTRRREQAITGTYEGAMRTLQQDFGDVLTKEEIEEFGGELAVELADPDLTPSEAAAITKAARTKAAREAGRRKHINRVVQEANDLLVEMAPSVDEEKWNQAHELIGDLRTAEDPDDVMAQIRLLVDPKAGAIARRVAADTTRNVMAQQALAQIVRENKPAIDASRKNAAPSRSDLGQDMTGYRRQASAADARGENPGMPVPGSAAAAPIAKFPTLSNLLAPEGEPTEADMIAEVLRARGLPVNAENIQRYGMGIIAEQRLRNSGSAPTARGAMFQ